ARDEVFQGDGGDLPRRQGERGPGDHGLLRDRGEPAARRGSRGRARRQRDRLAAVNRAVRGGGDPAPGAERRRDGGGRGAGRAVRGGRGRRPVRRPRPAPRGEVQGRRPDRHPTPGGGGRARLERGDDRGEVAERDGRAPRRGGDGRRGDPGRAGGHPQG